ncbi:hypothetical protein BCV71DRAFT_280152 [Rhizopus microsporus]|uniref:Uncharacterized protein n=1 Tax=Rhizopus microsporus TaxID=58291 RepID=A0A1X0S8S3_RHIZD|nr:hypothetical protein BCV71DRAFT_280152 [Rhizopus microsporus]
MASLGRARSFCKKAEAIIGIIERTAQNYVKTYRDDDEKRLPDGRKQRVSWDKKLQPHHTEFLCELYDKTPQAVLWQARDALLEAFDEIESITLSGLHRHLASYASLTLKKLETFVRLQEQLLVISRCVETGFLSGKVMKTVFSLMRQVLACIFVENLVNRREECLLKQ